MDHKDEFMRDVALRLEELQRGQRRLKAMFLIGTLYGVLILIVFMFGNLFGG